MINEKETRKVFLTIQKTNIENNIEIDKLLYGEDEVLKAYKTLLGMIEEEIKDLESEEL